MLTDDPELEGTPVPLPHDLVEELRAHLNELLSPRFADTDELPISYVRVPLSSRQDNGYGMNSCGWLVVYRDFNLSSSIQFSWVLDDNGCDMDAPTKLVYENGQHFLLFSHWTFGGAPLISGPQHTRWLNVDEAQKAVATLRGFPAIPTRERV